ncbi:MAG: carboxynorspermidine decarboxylase [Bacteroidetes bacterium]|nr:carboxynorspermidine decarboxylase [Bacteroidota bacterium]
MAVDFKNIPSPCYVLDEELLLKNLRLLEKVQTESGAEIICALKGFSMWSTFSHLKKYLKGATASSLNEAKLINEEMGCLAHTYCPVFLENEFDEIMNLSSHITFNSLNQFNYFKNRIQSFKRKISIGLRVNPEYSEVETDLYNPAQPGSRLGISSDKLSDKLYDGVEGVHFHVLCENDSFVLERTLEKVEEKFTHLIKQAKWVNMGGGHLITKEGYNVDHLIKLLKSFKSRYPNLENIILEPGGAIGWRTGYLVSTVLDIVESKGIKVAMLDVSFAAHMPDCLEMPYKPFIIGAEDAKPGLFNYRMGGTTCLAGDFMGMGDYGFKNELKIGDKIVFEDMIHYTMVKTTFFNGVVHPSIGTWKQNGEFVLNRTFNYQDFKNKLS